MWTLSLPLALLIATSVMVSSASPGTWNDLSEDYEDLFYPDGDRVFHRNAEDEDEVGDISEVDELRHLNKRSPIFPGAFLKFLKKKKKLGKREVEDNEDLSYSEEGRVFHRNDAEDEDEQGDISELEELRHLIKRSPLFPPKNLPIKKLCLIPPFKKLCKPKLPLKKKLGKREAEDYDDVSDSDEVRVFHRYDEDEEEWGKISEMDEPRHLVKRAGGIKQLLKLKKLPKLALKKKLFVKKSPFKKPLLKKLSKFALPLGAGGAGFAATQIIPRGPSLPRPRFRNPFSG